MFGIGYRAVEKTGGIKRWTKSDAGAAMDAFDKVQCNEECYDALPQYREEAR